MKNDTVNIIVIGYNLPDIERQCINSILQNTKHPYVLTYTDNYNSGKSLTQMWNKLTALSPCEYICLLNSDTSVYPYWLTRMMHTMLGDSKAGFVGPSTNNCHSPQKEVGSAEEAEKHKGEVVWLKDPISGFCILFKRRIWDELNGFDERYKLYGQESDFVDRAHKRGYKSLWRKDAFVYHIGEASVHAHGFDAEEERKRAKKLYWSERIK